MLADLARRGLVVTRPGSGTFTAALAAAPARRPVLADPGAGQRGPGSGPTWSGWSIRRRPGSIGLASGFPDERLQPLGPARGRRRPERRADRRAGAGCPPGPARAAQLHFAAEAGGGQLTEQNVLIASGGQAALSAVFRHLCAPGDPLIVESPTYVGALAAARAAGLALVPVPGDADGVLPDALADALARTGARLAYLQPRYANPAGSVLAPDRRGAVLAAAARAGAFLLEDDWMRDFDLGPPSPPPLISAGR